MWNLYAAVFAGEGVRSRAIAWLFRLGGIGLIPLGLLDNSVVPVPGSMDVFTIVLAARQRQWWLYYAIMATLGSVIGGYLTYQIGRTEGEGTARRVSKTRMERVTARFKRWGFGAIAIPAMLPPPMPMVPFLLAAGAARYPRIKFLTALALGRAARYTLLAFLAASYGRRALQLISGFGHPILLAVIAGVIVLGGLAAVFLVKGKRPGARRSHLLRISSHIHDLLRPA